MPKHRVCRADEDWSEKDRLDSAILNGTKYQKGVVLMQTRVSALKARARVIYSQYFKLILIAGLITVAYSFMGTELEYGLALTFLLAPVSIGLSWLYLNLYDGRPTDATMIFQPFKQYFKMVGAFFMVTMFTFFWAMLFFIPGLIKLLAYSQTFYLLKDHPEMGILEAITASRQMMKGRKWKLFLIYFSFALWYIPYILTYFLLEIIPLIMSDVLLSQNFGRFLFLADFSGALFQINSFANLALPLFLMPYIGLTTAAFYRERQRGTV